MYDIIPHQRWMKEKSVKLWPILGVFMLILSSFTPIFGINSFLDAYSSDAEFSSTGLCNGTG